jgi:hypothetical protein
MNNEIEKTELEKLERKEKFDKIIDSIFTEYDEVFRALAKIPDVELEKILVEKYGNDPNRKHASF